MNQQVRLSYETRREVIEAAGVEIANRNGLEACTLFSVSQRCSIPTSIPTIRSYYRTRDDLWTAIVSHPDAAPQVRKLGKKLGLIG